MDFQMLSLLMVVLACVEQSLASCVVESFTVKDDFDPKRYAGKWYALQKKDPEGLFLEDNISAEYTIGDDGSMVASSRGRVTLFGFWVVCADMAAQYSVPDPTTPGKMFMNYQGLASYLSSGGDNYWVIDTDYNNYAITYACRTLKEDGSCDDGYSLIFSRNPRGMPPPIQRLVRQKQEELCMVGQFSPVLQSACIWGEPLQVYFGTVLPGCLFGRQDVDFNGSSTSHLMVMSGSFKKQPRRHSGFQ
uniref:Purpurin-like n=1 Tax=Gadus morhua TaxID=8049 RepID=A0A8C4ZNK3_GADMO